LVDVFDDAVVLERNVRHAVGEAFSATPLTPTSPGAPEAQRKGC
jgi:hypothetical protein